MGVERIGRGAANLFTVEFVKSGNEYARACVGVAHAQRAA
jgi:hypothetical protein